MTLSAQSPPNASQPPEQASRDTSPIALIAVVAVSALVIILCVLGATFSGLFSFFTTATPGNATAPEASILASDAGPLSRFEDGQYLVMRDVRPGTYAATVPAGSAGCTWERNATTDGTAKSVLESGQGDPGEQIVIHIRETDKVFQSQGCGLWERTAD